MSLGRLVGADANCFLSRLEVPRTREGYYHCTAGIEVRVSWPLYMSQGTHAHIQMAIKRAIAFAPYSDMVWLETKTPNLEQAKSFARRIREQHPGKYVWNGTMATPDLRPDFLGGWYIT